VTACHCCATDEQFDPGIARRDLKSYRRRGPNPATRQLLAAVQAARLSPEPTLIDVGGGIGAIHHQLLERGFVRAVQVDVSQAYLSVSATEAERLGHAGRVTFRHGDFREVAADILPADVVTLDRVVCCDPDFAGMLGTAADHARRLLAFSYPRPRWITRAFVAASNAWRRLWGRAFRVYVHQPGAMTAILEGRGLRRRWAGGTWIWAVEMYERPAGG
jgi:methyltransferase family protein